MSCSVNCTLVVAVWRDLFGVSSFLPEAEFLLERLDSALWTSSTTDISVSPGADAGAKEVASASGSSRDIAIAPDADAGAGAVAGFGADASAKELASGTGSSRDIAIAPDADAGAGAGAGSRTGTTSIPVSSEEEAFATMHERQYHS